MMHHADALGWLMRWYESQCDGDWEHSYGIEISTLDNPGWSLKIDLSGTPLDGKVIERRTFDYEHDTERWTCWTEANQYHAAGGPQKLKSMVQAFRDWVEEA